MIIQFLVWISDFLNFLYSIRSLIDKKDFIEVVITKSNLIKMGFIKIKNKLDYYTNQQIFIKKLLSEYNVNYR